MRKTERFRKKISSFLPILVTLFRLYFTRDTQQTKTERVVNDVLYIDLATTSGKREAIVGLTLLSKYLVGDHSPCCSRVPWSASTDWVGGQQKGRRETTILKMHDDDCELLPRKTFTISVEIFLTPQSHFWIPSQI